jgi:hypothetical protein
MNSSLTSSSAALFPQAEVLGLTGETQRESGQNEHAHVQENRHNQLQVHNIHQHFHDLKQICKELIVFSGFARNHNQLLQEAFCHTNRHLSVS